MLIIVAGFFLILFFVIGTEMYLSLEEGTQPSRDMWVLLGQVLTGIIGIISGYLVGKEQK